MTPDPVVAMLRHTLATLAYRAGKVLRGFPPELAEFRASPGARTPVEILAHMGDLFDWALSLANGTQVWNNSIPLAWDEEVARFFRTLDAFDRRLIAAAEQPMAATPEKLFQGPVADALTHTGQLALLLRMAGSPIRAENYLVAEISEGRVGLDQARPRKEFD